MIINITYHNNNNYNDNTNKNKTFFFVDLHERELQIIGNVHQ